jgi:mRNA interferase RelE/StbE
MNYTILIKKQAKKKLQTLSGTDRLRITEKIVLLAKNPDDKNLDIKRLEGEPYYRLRIGKWRIIFDRQDAINIIAIEKIKPRGDVYK